MSVEKGLTTITMPAGANLSAKQYYFVEGSTAGQLTACNAKGDAALGVLQNDPAAAGRSAVLAIGGVTKVIASTTATAAIAVNDALISNASGKAIKASTGGTAFVMGRAMSAASTGISAAVISMLLTYEGPSSTA